MSPKILRKNPLSGVQNVALQVSLRDLLNTIFFYRLAWSSIVLACLLLSVVVAFVVPPTYRAEARLLTLFAGYYDMQMDHSSDRAAPSFDPAQVVNVESQILSSPELHRAIVKEEIGGQISDTDLDKAMQTFETRFHLEKVDAANLIELSYSDADPQHAAHILEKLIAQYYKQRSGVFTQGRLSFLVAQRDKVRDQLDAANAQLTAFQRSHGVANIDSQIASAVALRALLEQRHMENDSALAQDSKTLFELSRQAKGVSAEIEQFRDNTEVAHAIDTMQLSLLQLKGRRADLVSRYMEESPFVKELDSQIADVQKAIVDQSKHLAGAVRTGHNNYYDTVHDRLMRLASDVAGETARKGALDDQIREAEGNLQQLITVSNQLRRMEIDRDLLVESFKTFSRQVEEVRIEQNQMDTASSTNVRIIQAPFPPTHRSNPPILFVAAGLVIGILLACISVIMLSSLRETFLSPEEIERSLALPVLIAPLRGRQLQSLFQRVFGRPDKAEKAEKAAPIRPMDFGRLIMAINNSTEKASKIVQMLSFHQDDGLPAVVQGLVEDLEPRAIKPVLLLDLAADGHFPHAVTDGWAHLDDHADATAVGDTEDDAVNLAHQYLTFSTIPGRRVVVARPKPGVTLPSGPQATNLFAVLRRSYDFIVIHSPTAAQSFVGIENSVEADATILAIRAEDTRKPVALTLKTQIQEAGGLIAGVVMTNRQSYIPNCVYKFL